MFAMTSCLPPWLLGVLLLGQTSSVSGQAAGEEPITCAIPSVPVGATASLTCYLPAQTSSWRQVSIQRYRAGHPPDSVLDCDRSSSDLKCIVYDTNTVFNQSTMVDDSEVTIHIEKAGPADEIVYKCQVPGYTEANTCSFHLESPGSSCGGWLVAVVVLAVLVALLVLILLLRTLFKRKMQEGKTRWVNGVQEKKLKKQQTDLQDKQRAAEEGVELLVRHKTELQDQLRTTDAERETLVKETSDLKTDLETARTEKDNLQLNLEAEKLQLEAEKKEMDAMNEELDAVASGRRGIYQEKLKLAPIPELQEKLEKERQDLENLQKENSSLVTAISNIKDKNEKESTLSQALKQRQEELHTTAENVRVMEENLLKTREELKDKEKSKTDLQKQLKVSDRDLTSLSTKMQALEKKGMFQKLQNEIETLRQRLDAEGGEKETVPPQPQKEEDGGQEKSNRVSGALDWDLVESLNA